MDLMSLLSKAGGEQSLQQMASKLGLPTADAGKMVEALAPALQSSLKQQASTAGGLANLHKALSNGNHDRYLKNPELLQKEETVQDGNKILGHLLGSKDVSRSVAAQAAERTGFDVSMLKKALPLVASMTMGAMGRSAKAESESESSSGVLAVLDMLKGGDEGGNPLGAALGFARKLF